MMQTTSNICNMQNISPITTNTNILQISKTERQYVQLLKDLLDAPLVRNERTGTACHTIINPQSFTYTADDFPALTIRRSYWKSAVAEMLGYIRGYTSAKDFRELGTKTWDANANQNPAWLANPHRAGVDDMGLVYGAVGNSFTGLSFADIMRAIHARQDNRGLIWSFWNPDLFDKGCLRPCMYSHQFSIVDDTLYLTSTQRSCDVPLGLTFNMIQCWFLLYLVCALTGLKFGHARHNIVNAHIYENQVDAVREMIANPLLPRNIKFQHVDQIAGRVRMGVEDIDNALLFINNCDVSDFELLGYDELDVPMLKNKIPFSV